MLTILQHKSSSYGPRTYENAHGADVTIAIAADHNTAGERCTQKAVFAANQEILKLSLLDNYLNMARQAWHRVKDIENVRINIAGNGIYTLNKHGWTQDKINHIVYDILAKVNQHHPIGAIRSGGQTGVDLAGGVAGVALGIPTTLLLPKGYKQRHENGVDVEHTEDDIFHQVMEGVAQLKLA